MSRLAVVKEIAGEARVSATPQTVSKIVALGFEVVVEKGAGLLSSYPDAQYVKAGAKIVTRAQAWASPIILKVGPPQNAEIAREKTANWLSTSMML